MSEAASLVEVVHGVRVTPSLAFCGSDPMYLLPHVLVACAGLVGKNVLVYCTGSSSSRSQLTI